MTSYTRSQEISLVIMRVTLAAIFLYAGYAKIAFWTTPMEGMAEGMVNLIKFVSIVEPLGAVAVLAGFLTRWAAAGLAIIMIGAIYIMQFTMNMGFVTEQGAGWNFPLMVLAGCVILWGFGAGRWSLDAARCKKS